MRIIELDGSRMDSVENTHLHLQETMTLPEYDGNSLDGMHDELMKISENTFIFVLNSRQMEESLGDYSREMKQVWKDLEQENKHLCFFMR